MKASYDYYYTMQAVGQLNIEDIGNCIISCNNDDGEFYYLIIKTKLGVTKMFEYGPHINGGFPTHVYFSFTQIDYNELRIDKTIDKFLNMKGRNITQAQILDDIEQVRPFIKNFDDFVYKKNT